MKLKIVSLFVFSSFVISGCSLEDLMFWKKKNNQPEQQEESSEEPQSEDKDQTYTIKFISNDVLIKQVDNAKYGEYIDIPVLESEDSRQQCIGWSGISEKEFLSGKIKVYETDATYYAKWNEMFGTETIYDVPRIKSGEDVVIDGLKDEAYSDAAPVVLNTISQGETNTTATAYFIWDESNIYALFEVDDETYIPFDNNELQQVDSLEYFIDLLHSDIYAEDGYTTGWGQPYRGEPGPMCEAQFAIGAGVSFPKDGKRYGAGSEFGYSWLSHAARESGKTVGTTYKTENGYNVEYLIDCTDTHIPTELRPHINQEIGMGVNIYDHKVDENVDGVISLEKINIEMEETPKRLSNFRLIKNPREDKDILTATKVRDCYLTNDIISYKDSTKQLLGDNEIQLLWDENGVHGLINFAEETSTIVVSSTKTSNKTTLSSSEMFDVAVTGLEINDYVDLTFEITNSEETSLIETIAYCKTNSANIDPARKLFSAKKTSAGDDIEIDGVKDDEYNKSSKIDISYKSLEENNSLDATAEAYILWDDSYLYIFVEVKDEDVNLYTSEEHPEQNDSVELWISTCQSFPGPETTWGNSNRPYNEYCGEGLFRMKAGSSSDDLTGFHWMFDDKTNVYRNASSVLTSTGYTVEYKIGWATFANLANKENQIIDFNININDCGDSNRKGIVSTNAYGHLGYLQPYYLDHLQLLGEE